MSKRTHGWLPPLLLLIVAACGGNQSNQAVNSAAFDTVKLPAYSGYTAVSVTHSVKDFNAWLKVYSNVSAPESRISVYASPDDPNLVTVFELTRSHKDARNAFDSDRLKKAMRDAGVTSVPIYRYFDVKYRATGKTEKVYRLGVSHAVSNYETWRKAFDEDEPLHREAGLELRAISTNEEDPGMVNVLFATNDIDKAKELINSDELRKKMSLAGVRSEPAFTVLKVPDLQ